MEPLKTLWRQPATHSDRPADDLFAARPLPDFSRLRAEEGRRRKWMPLTNAFLVVMTIGLGFFYYRIGALTGWQSWLGFYLIVGSVVAIGYFTQWARLPLSALAPERATGEFVRAVGRTLRRRIRGLGVGLFLQTVALATGLWLMIGADASGWSAGATGLWFGVWFGLGGLTTGVAVAAYRRHYREELAMVAEFEGEELV